MSLQSNIPTFIPEIIKDIPREDLPDDEQMGLLWKSVAIELGEMILYASTAKNPQIIFTPFRKGGSQYLAEFCVNDLEKEKRETHNWHGQNTSQWLYAGAIVIQDGKVSRHH